MRFVQFLFFRHALVIQSQTISIVIARNCPSNPPVNQLKKSYSSVTNHVTTFIQLSIFFSLFSSFTLIQKSTAIAKFHAYSPLLETLTAFHSASAVLAIGIALLQVFTFHSDNLHPREVTAYLFPRACLKNKNCTKRMFHFPFS